MSGDGRIVRISGPTVVAEGLQNPGLFDLVRVGRLGIIGEIIRLEDRRATIQVYEETVGLGPGEPVESSGGPLTAELGPGLLGSLFDGIQRPLREIRDSCGAFIPRGTESPALSRDRVWEFSPSLKPGDAVRGGDILGTVGENEVVEHRVLAPPDVEGRVASVHRGECSVTDTVATLDDGREIPLLQRWPVRTPRPAVRKLEPETVFITGQRVLDSFFPLAEGGTAAVPGGFGTGKTVVQHSLARYAAADIIIFVGCGERGNEIADLLAEFPHLTDPYRGLPLMHRTVIIANTSNMPVAAREASLYTAVTMAEYYRDQGYRVALMADSISRWAEALREISSRLEELPGEEGYPTYLPARLASFTERGGRVLCLGGGGRRGSVTMICAVSPPGGDFSEPVTQSALRSAGTLWALDSSLAHRRHFPAINPRQSYSLYHEILRSSLAGAVAGDWTKNVFSAMATLQREEELQEVVQLVGIESIPDTERILLETGRMIREAFLAQNAFHEADAFCPLEKQHEMLRVILRLHDRMNAALEKGVSLENLLALPFRELVTRMKEIPGAQFRESVGELEEKIARVLEEAVEAAGPRDGPEGEER